MLGEMMWVYHYLSLTTPTEEKHTKPRAYLEKLYSSTRQSVSHHRSIISFSKLKISDVNFRSQEFL